MGDSFGGDSGGLSPLREEVVVMVEVEEVGVIPSEVIAGDCLL